MLGYFKRTTRWHPLEIAFWVGLVAVYFVPDVNIILLGPDPDLGSVRDVARFVVGLSRHSVDGPCGIFGIGAYTAGFLGEYGWTEPSPAWSISMLVAGVIGL